MSTHIGRFRPGLVTALVKVAMIGSWNGRTFLDDNLDLADVADFVPVEPAASVRLPLVDQPVAEPPVIERPVADTGHSVAA